MIGVILAAGMGTRLMPLTKDIPKALLKINDITLLERMIKNCIDSGICKFIVVIGYNGEKVEQLSKKLEDKYNIEIKIIINEKYDITNTSVSTYLASRFIEKESLDDFILVNGDNVVDPLIIKRLSKSSNSSMIIDNYKQLNEESFKLIIDNKSFNNDKTITNGIINSIGKELDIDSSTGEFIGISKIVKSDISDFNKFLNESINENPQNYYDFSFKDLSEIKTIDFILTNGLKWSEIDDINDWEYAQRLVEELEG
ncbi:sugar phosphate nucleotidyltransferase [uncultured Methanobrevibacter sp.]|uniref:phosphocholine cytidylyltransferase family protein n=1 Tax=uncultured Methanobrevibacter sp. TaxID=253161 RepID=UPI0025EE9FF9|nr:sugar phosphate nucleotidyltransferase [uncultured Methanobrevibacter sp.]